MINITHEGSSKIISFFDLKKGDVFRLLKDPVDTINIKTGEVSFFSVNQNTHPCFAAACGHDQKTSDETLKCIKCIQIDLDIKIKDR
jgi:hypothetical protein